MNKSFVYGIIGLLSMLLASVGYVAGHKYFSAPFVIGVATALWQILVAFLLIAIAGGIGEQLFKFSNISGLVRFGLTAALGLITLSIGILIWGSTVGTSPISFATPLLVLLIAFRKKIIDWLKNLENLTNIINSKFEIAIALGVIVILGGNLMLALAPPVEWDSLVYHYGIPNAYLNIGRITYLPDTMFWGMPQLTEMLYLPLISLAGAETPAVFGVFIASLTIIGILGYAKSKFTSTAAWMAIAALLASGTLSWTISTGYVDWMSMLFGWAAIVALDEYLENQDQRMLILAGIFCGGALGTKYTAGILSLGSFLALLLLQKYQNWRNVFSRLLIFGLAIILASSPWWIKNFIATGNPFYPFFVPSGAMDQVRLRLYQNMPPWGDWKAVILLPWQATFMDDGYAATIGPLLVGISPLALVNWQIKNQSRKKAILITAIIAITGFILWAIASRTSAFLMQTRLYFVIFPAWAILAGAGIDAVWDMNTLGIRFGKVIAMLALVMYGANVLSYVSTVTSINPMQYVFRNENRQDYLRRRLQTYMAAMEEIQNLPEYAHVLMLWEPKGYYCQPRCDADEALDRWPSDSNGNPDSQSIIDAWREEGYTHLLIWNWGRQFVQKENPQGAVINWDLLDSTLAVLPVEKQIGGGIYTLYKLP